MPPQVMCPAVMSRRRQETIEDKLDWLVLRVDRTVEQCRRFEEFANHMATFAARWPATALAHWLDLDDLDRTTHNMALVALALKGSAAAGAAIDGYDPTDYGEDHELFYQVVRIEWEQRYREANQQKKAS